MPYTQDPAELAGVDVAIVGAPTDDVVSDRPGARFGPRAIRAAFLPAGPPPRGGCGRASPSCGWSTSATPPSCRSTQRAHTRRSSRPWVQVLDAGAVPSCSAALRYRQPDIRAGAARHPRVGLIHFDTHTDTGKRGLWRRGLARDADVPAGRGRVLVDPALRADRPARVLAGEREFSWQRERGITSLFVHDVRDRGISRGGRRGALEAVGEGPAFLKRGHRRVGPFFFAPGTGIPSRAG